MNLPDPIAAWDTEIRPLELWRLLTATTMPLNPVRLRLLAVELLQVYRDLQPEELQTCRAIVHTVLHSGDTAIKTFHNIAMPDRVAPLVSHSASVGCSRVLREAADAVLRSPVSMHARACRVIRDCFDVPQRRTDFPTEPVLTTPWVQQYRVLSPSLRTEDVCAMAESCRQGDDAFAPLSDALEEAGAPDFLVDHLQHRCAKTRWCWVVNLFASQRL